MYQSSVAFVFNKAAKRHPERIIGFFLQVGNDKVVVIVVDLEGSLEPLMILVGID